MDIRDLAEGLYVTNHLNLMLQQEGVTPAMQENVVKGVLFYRDEYNRVSVALGGISAAASIFEAMDELIKEDIKGIGLSCKRGCSHCCHINVDIHEDEADILVQFCEENNITIDLKHLQGQVGLNNEQRPRSPFSACMFLNQKTGDCKVYEYRPISCRKYFVKSHPKFCNFKKGTKKVAVFSTANVEMMTSGVANAVKQTGQMAEMILKSLNRKKNEMGIE